ncbi:hypothetical protein K7W42_17960 [Deinococcus sp. HMF7604]|uniref:hypothetical protein n=1 Tax=Deinococcus betulae TaxID=2873312 RepID=UPI001CCABDA8|nr:hypothetical protein [Deinococcus betulae]MBZ9752730.1 hypothetical protein [Deinococcus betulae]
MALTQDQQDELEELVGPAAWAYHQALPADQRVNVERAFRVRQSIALVAAAVLEAACTAARRAGATVAAAVKGVKIGKVEVQLAASQSGGAQSGDADAWCALAADLRAQVQADRREAQQQGSMSLDVEVSF